MDQKRQPGSGTEETSSDEHDDLTAAPLSSSSYSSQPNWEQKQSSFTSLNASNAHRRQSESIVVCKQSPGLDEHDSASAAPSPPLQPHLQQWRLEHSFAAAALTLLLLQFLLAQFVPYTSLHDESTFGQAGEHLQTNREWQTHNQTLSISKSRCAILFWGLPRAFESLVLPSIERNVIRINAKYDCDYYMHYFVREEEQAGRSGEGGHIDSNQVYQLKPSVERIQQSPQGRIPIVEFAFTKDLDFLIEHQELLQKIRDTVDANGKHLYFPDNARTYTFPVTTDNIIRMWHTIREAWKLMEMHENKQGVTYDRVAMLRNDVLYATPIDIYQLQAKTNTTDHFNSFAVIPGFGRHPVSDRLIYGPRRAVQIWALQRFSRLEQHVQWIQKHDPGWGLHSERFVNYTLFRAMRNNQGVNVVEHDTICFMRARSDSSVWVSDCDGVASVTLPSIAANLERIASSKRELVEQVIGRQCEELTRRTKPMASVLHCPPPDAATAT
ncbi:hypothetical protein MPSEU_000837800 [Mayamaea pseudoterrestris]|nr:hypothetical protein MPSEU_000837800 [Mayamaea pseudoterrestris]